MCILPQSPPMGWCVNNNNNPSIFGNFHLIHLHSSVSTGGPQYYCVTSEIDITHFCETEHFILVLFLIA